MDKLSILATMLSSRTLIVVTATIIAAGLLSTGTFSPAFAVHNDQGHEEKTSVGECKSLGLEPEICQDPESKQDFKDFRKEGPPPPPVN